MMLFADTYARDRDRKSGGEGAEEALAQMRLWLRTRVPFCYVRFVDGEFNAILGREGENCDGHSYQRDGLGQALEQTLWEVKALYPRHGNVLVGVGALDRADIWSYLNEHHLLTMVPWGPANAFVAGLESGATVEFLKALDANDQPKVLVANEAVAKARECIGAEWVAVPRRNCWQQRLSIMEAVTEKLSEGGVAIWCAGMPASVLAWRCFRYPNPGAHIDMGSFFDGAVGMDSRARFRKDTPWRRRYDEEIVPAVESGEWS